MREYDDAIGTIASCCSVLNNGFRSYISENGRRYIDVPHRDDFFTIVAPPRTGAFTVVNGRRLTNKSEFSIDESVPVAKIESEVEDRLMTLEAQNTPVSLDELTQFVGEEGLEYFDGVRAQRPLYVYDDGFGPEEFDECLTEVGRTARVAFNDLLDIVDIELDDIDEASSEESEDPASPAFQ